MAEDSERPSLLLSLPPEIREHIYRLILHPAANQRQLKNDYYSYNYKDALVLFRINRQIYYESRKVFRHLNRFVKVETPWPQAADHVAVEGHVPMIMRGSKADEFGGHIMSVQVVAPEYAEVGDYMERFVILAEDVENFAKIWMYSALSHPLLNEHLRLVVRLCDPFTPEYEEKKMPKSLQTQLLLPFGMVKNLQDVSITGDPKPLPSIVAEMRSLQAQPYESPEHCLRECRRFKDEGNDALKAGNYYEALSLYSQAWEAMHVVVRGHERHVHAEAFFEHTLSEEPFVGKNAQVERLLLRVALVANTCQVLLKLEDYDECMFWGLRTIKTIRQAIGFTEDAHLSADDEYVHGFVAGTSMGKIYYRTALAYKAVDDKSEARRLLRVAEKYLPNDKFVKEEIAACALRIG
ncbi:hypothetical protein MBLNU230_g7974t1 [Neophaeotheca triangularis]